MWSQTQVKINIKFYSWMTSVSKYCNIKLIRSIISLVFSAIQFKSYRSKLIGYSLDWKGNCVHWVQLRCRTTQKSIIHLFTRKVAVVYVSPIHRVFFLAGAFIYSISHTKDLIQCILSVFSCILFIVCIVIKCYHKVIYFE